ncbi:hypothetical protein GCM10009534_20170 [Kribbella sandramycini]
MGACVVVKVAGAVDDRTADSFAEELRRVITTKGATVVVDVRRVREIDAAGVEVLVTAAELARQRDGWLRVAGAKPWLSTRLGHHAIPAYSELKQALPAYRRSAL